MSSLPSPGEDLVSPCPNPSRSTDQKLISGEYSSGQYVFVYGEKDCDYLKSLGHFGHNLSRALKREASGRIGYQDKRLIQLMSSDDQPEFATALTLSEAYFLAYSLGCLAIKLKKTPNPLSLEELWSEFRNYYNRSNSQVDFAIEYGVYHYFRSRGWIVKSGDNYCTNFLLYREGPSYDHAQYAVISVHESNEDLKPVEWKSLLTYQRVIQSVSKELMVVYVSSKSCSPDAFNDPRNLKDLRIMPTTFTNHSNAPSK